MKKGFTIVETIFLLFIMTIAGSVIYEKATGKQLITEEMVKRGHQEALEANVTKP